RESGPRLSDWAASERAGAVWGAVACWTVPAGTGVAEHEHSATAVAIGGRLEAGHIEQVGGVAIDIAGAAADRPRVASEGKDGGDDGRGGARPTDTQPPSLAKGVKDGNTRIRVSNRGDVRDAPAEARADGAGLPGRQTGQPGRPRLKTTAAAARARPRSLIPTASVGSRLQVGAADSDHRTRSGRKFDTKAIIA